MSDFVTTPVLGLYKPTYDADDDQWGYHLNENFDILDGVLTPAGADARYLPLSGGTLAGPLTVGGILEVTTGHLQLINDGSTEDAFAYVDLSADIGGMNLIRGHSPGFALTWWTLALGDGPPSADFSVTRYDDAGGIIDHPLTISRATGVVTFGPVPPTVLTRRSGAAPGTTAVAGVGSLQGHTVNGTVIQGNGSTNDFMLNNKNGAAALSLATGTTNWSTPGTLTFNAPGAQTTGKSMLSIAPPSGIGSSGAVTGRALSVTTSFSGTSTESNVSFNRINTVSDTLDSSGSLPSQGAYHLYVGHTLAAGLKGGRTTLGTVLNMTGASANPSSKYYVAQGASATANVSDNGTPGAERSNLFGNLTIAILRAAATSWLALTTMELDVVAEPGSSVLHRKGLTVVAWDGDGAQGSVDDFAIGIGMTANNATSLGFKRGLQFGIASGWWCPFGTMIGIAGVYASGSPAPTAVNGIDFAPVTFSGKFLNSVGFSVDGVGNLIAQAASLTRATLSAGITCGSQLATGADLSKHLALYAGTFGLNVISGAINIVSNGVASVAVSSTGVTVAGTARINGNVGFNNTAPIARPTVSGAKGSNAALASLITALANYGLITDTTTA